jgi:hypothetical protein
MGKMFVKGSICFFVVAFFLLCVVFFYYYYLFHFYVLLLRLLIIRCTWTFDYIFNRGVNIISLPILSLSTKNNELLHTLSTLNKNY